MMDTPSRHLAIGWNTCKLLLLYNSVYAAVETAYHDGRAPCPEGCTGLAMGETGHSWEACKV